MTGRWLGSTQVAILRTVCDGRWFRAERSGQYRSCLRLNALGYLRRDPTDSRRFTATENGRALIIAHDAKLSRAST